MYVLAPCVISSLYSGNKTTRKSQLVQLVIKRSILWASVEKVQAKFVRSINVQTYKENLMSKLMCRLWRKPCRITEYICLDPHTILPLIRAA